MSTITGTRIRDVGYHPEQPASEGALKDVSTRIGFIGAGMVVLSASLNLWIQGLPYQYPISLGLSFFAWGAGVTLIILGLVRSVHQRLVWLVLAGLLFAQLTYAYLDWLNYTPLSASHTDNEMIARFAAQALERGQNPYSWNYSDYARVFRDRGLYVTPFLDGAVQSRLTYPALPTLTLAGLDLLGIGQVRALNLIFQVFLLTIVFFGAPGVLRPVVLLPLFLLQDLVHLPLNGIQDVVWCTLLVGVIWAWKRPALRAILFGMACAYRQQPWIAAPFLLIFIWNEPGTAEIRRRRILHFAGISLGVFALVNIPFIIWNAREWWLGVFEPAYAPFNVYSYGLAALSQYGLTSLPRQFYTGLQVASLAIMLVFHWRHPRFVGQAFWIFPAFFFWLYYRSLTNYWIYWIPPLLIGLARHLGSTSITRATVPERPLRWKFTGAVAVTLVLPLVIWGGALDWRRSAIAVSYSVPLEIIDYGQKLVNRVRVTVTNTSGEALAPRFAVQRDTGIQALPWSIDSGPEGLGPGESGEYTISARIPARAFPVELGGQIVVTDAGGDYGRRVVYTIPADRTFTNPDLIVNPRFEFWPRDGNAPAEWSLETTGDGLGTARIERIDDRTALAIRLDVRSVQKEAATVRLAQTITFPPEFAIWVYPTLPTADPLEQAFGVELDDGHYRLRILFGDADGRGRLDEHSGYVFLAAPMERWSKHIIRPSELYDEFGWPPPPCSPRWRNGLEFPSRQIRLSLFVASRSRGESSGVFGPIEQGQKLIGPKAFVAEALAKPDTYYVNLGDTYRMQRNYDLALDAYLKALDQNPTMAEGYFGLAEARFWLDDWVAALKDFEKASEYGFRQTAFVHRGMGWSYYNLGDYAQAKIEFLQAIREDPTLADGYNGLGWILVQQQHCERAMALFERARALAPDFPDPQRGIEECAGSK